MSEFYTKHQATLHKAIEVKKTREYWSAYPEMPSRKIYGEDAAKDGLAAFEAQLNNDFKLDNKHPNDLGLLGAETSPFGFELNIKYPAASPTALIAASKEAGKSWAKLSLNQRAGILLEILSRINANSFEMAQAVMHTTGQAFAMAFQAGGPHAQDRALEAVAYAYDIMSEIPATASWVKPQGKHDPIKMQKSFRLIPRGVSVVIGCSTFPTWNSYPGMFASLMCGNTSIVKTHSGAILPAAISVKLAREVLAEAGIDPNVVVLAVDTSDAPITKGLVQHEDVKIIDYTGNSAFGTWIENNAPQAQVYTEKAGLNSIVIESVDNMRAASGNIAFSLSLYSGQMCTTPQNIFIPKDGIETSDGHMSFDDVAKAITVSISKLLGEPARANGILGAIQNPATYERAMAANDQTDGDIMLTSLKPENQEFADARQAGPVIIKLDASQKDIYETEKFGPISYLIACDDADQALELAASGAKNHGAITTAVYSMKADFIEQAEDAFAEAGVALSCNLVGNIFVNQSAAFSDYHVSGANPAGNACLADTAYVANRFRVAASRKLV